MGKRKRVKAVKRYGRIWAAILPDGFIVGVRISQCGAKAVADDYSRAGAVVVPGVFTPLKPKPRKAK